MYFKGVQTKGMHGMHLDMSFEQGLYPSDSWKYGKRYEMRLKCTAYCTRNTTFALFTSRKLE